MKTAQKNKDAKEPLEQGKGIYIKIWGPKDAFTQNLFTTSATRALQMANESGEVANVLLKRAENSNSNEVKIACLTTAKEHLSEKMELSNLTMARYVLEIDDAEKLSKKCFKNLLWGWYYRGKLSSLHADYLYLKGTYRSAWEQHEKVSHKLKALEKQEKNASITFSSVEPAA